MRFGVWVSGFGAWGLALGFRAWGSGFGVQDWNFGGVGF